MMKIKAVILLLHFLVYFTSSFAAVQCHEKRSEKMMCCKRTASKHQSPPKCPQPSENKPDCYNCPLLYTATLPAAVTISIQSVLIKKEFSFIQNGKPHGFSTAVWKPPNTM